MVDPNTVLPAEPWGTPVVYKSEPHPPTGFAESDALLLIMSGIGENFEAAEVLAISLLLTPEASERLHRAAMALAALARGDGAEAERWWWHGG